MHANKLTELSHPDIASRTECSLACQIADEDLVWSNTALQAYNNSTKRTQAEHQSSK